MDTTLPKYEPVPPPLSPAEQQLPSAGQFPVQAGYQPAPALQQTASNVTVVTQGPQQWQHAPLQPKPNNYLPLSIINMLCCCFIFGIIALIYSLQVDSSYTVGDYEGARRAAGSAKAWNIAALATGITVYAVVAAIVVIYLIAVP